MDHTAKNDMTTRMDARDSTNFDKFMARPETKLMLSLIPPADNPDAMKVLLRASFDAGVSSGSGTIIGEMLTAMIKDNKPKRDPMGPF